MNLQLQLPEPRSKAVRSAIESLSAEGDPIERGAVFTKLGVVRAILDLSGYTEDGQLHERRLLEPSFGQGEFLLEAIRRLLTSYQRSGSPIGEVGRRLGHAIRGVELHRPTFDETFERAVNVLIEAGADMASALKLVRQWLVNDDFLLTDLAGEFHFVVGNPPYVRQERIPAPLLQEYRRRYATLYDRADLYVLFYEKGLDLLAADGSLGFICANRWIKNKYGGPLRQKVSKSFHLKYFIDMESADAFTSEVIAYPAITVIERAAKRNTHVALSHQDVAHGLDDLVTHLVAASNAKQPRKSNAVSRLKNVANGRDPWLLDAPMVLSILRQLEYAFPTLESAGAKVGIGVATGADRVFINAYDDLPVEEDRKLRLAMAADCAHNVVSWGGQGVVNPYLPSGELASFGDYPLFARYMEANAAALKKRHTARSQPDRWYKTIDRIYPDLTHTPKLLIPDIKGVATVAYDGGACYPHHNLYVVTSEQWDLRALQAILRSSVALMFVAAYGVKMAGGFLRFQAQYLRRIRCPNWSELSRQDVRRLIGASALADQEAVDEVVYPLYGLGSADRKAICSYARAARISPRER